MRLLPETNNGKTIRFIYLFLFIYLYVTRVRCEVYQFVFQLVYEFTAYADMQNDSCGGCEQ